jgi:hypothetical protein
MGDKETRFYEVSSFRDQENLKGHVRISEHQIPDFQTLVRKSGHSKKGVR